MGRRTDVPDVAEDFAGVGHEERGEFTVILPGAGDGVLVDGAAGGVEEKRFGRDVGLRAVEADVALALLLGIVEGMRVEKGPNELAGGIFEGATGKGGLVAGGVAGGERGGGGWWRQRVGGL